MISPVLPLMTGQPSDALVGVLGSVWVSMMRAHFSSPMREARMGYDH